MNSRFLVSCAISACLFGDTSGGVTATLKIRQNGQVPAVVVVDEGSSVALNVEYTITSSNASERFVANRPPQPFNGAVLVPTGNPSNPAQRITALQFNVQDNQTQDSGGVQFQFDAVDNQTFAAALSGTVTLETAFDTVVGTFSFNAFSQNIIVRNVAPTLLGTLGDRDVVVGEQFFLSAAAFDPGVRDTLTFDWDIGADGTVEAQTVGRDSQVSVISDSSVIVPVRVTVRDNDGGTNSAQFNVRVLPSSVVARGLFYAGATGDSAQNSFASDKAALMPGQTASFSNYTNYSLGLNGMMIDIAYVPPATTNEEMLSSLQFSVWNGINESGFTPLPTSATPNVAIVDREGVNQSTRIFVIFPNNTVQNTWLQVTVLANRFTGLATPEVHYFGNVVGDVNIGNTATRLRVNATDTGAVRSNQSTSSNSVSVTNLYDVNRDGRVNATDTGLVRSNQQTSGIVAPLTAPSANTFTTPMSSRLATDFSHAIKVLSDTERRQ